MGDAPKVRRQVCPLELSLFQGQSRVDSYILVVCRPMFHNSTSSKDLKQALLRSLIGSNHMLCSWLQVFLCCWYRAVPKVRSGGQFPTQDYHNLIRCLPKGTDGFEFELDSRSDFMTTPARPHSGLRRNRLSPDSERGPLAPRHSSARPAWSGEDTFAASVGAPAGRCHSDRGRL